MIQPLIGVLGLQGDVAEHLHSIAAIGAVGRVIRRQQDLIGLDGLIIPGGESTVISQLLLHFKLLLPLRSALADGLPVWGTCAGMILMASNVLDGRSDQVSLNILDITVRRNAFGSQVNSFEEELVVSGLVDPYPAIFIRAPAVESVGPTVRILATSQCLTTSGHRAIVAVANEQALATSFHPEISGDIALHKMFVQEFVTRRSFNDNPGY